MQTTGGHPARCRSVTDQHACGMQQPQATGLHSLRTTAFLTRSRAAMRRQCTAATVQCIAGQALYLGMDFGTSGARAIAIDGERDQTVVFIPV
jgi:hypothetical protein